MTNTLEGTLQAMQAAFNERRLEDYLTFVDENAHLTLATVTYPLEGREAIAEITRSLYADATRLGIEFSVRYVREFGDTGLVAGIATFWAELEDGTRPLQHQRATLLFNRVDTAWKCVGGHYSPIPPAGDDVVYASER